MHIAANVDFIFKDVDYVKAIRNMNDLGFKNLEVVFVRILKEKSIEKLKELKDELGVNYEVMMTDFIHWLNEPNYVPFVEAAAQRAQEAKYLGCDKVILFTDNAGIGLSNDENLARIEECVNRILPYYEKEKVKILLEPINNKIDHKEASLWDLEASINMIRKFNSPYFRMLFDIYHMQIMYGDVLRTMIDNIDIIDHLHMAGNPGRNEIFKGELNYVNILRTLQENGYKGSAGLEYAPSIPPEEGLKIIYSMLKEFM